MEGDPGLPAKLRVCPFLFCQPVTVEFPPSSSASSLLPCLLSFPPFQGSFFWILVQGEHETCIFFFSFPEAAMAHSTCNIFSLYVIGRAVLHRKHQLEHRLFFWPYPHSPTSPAISSSSHPQLTAPCTASLPALFHFSCGGKRASWHYPPPANPLLQAMSEAISDLFA